MKLIDYLKDQWISILLFIFTFIFSILLLIAFKVVKECIFAIGLIMITGFIIALSYDYYRKHKFYNQLISTLESLDQKYLITEIIHEPDFLEGKLLFQQLIDINKSMLEHINEYQNNIHDFKEYIEMWIHEVKIPIASLTLYIHNHPDLPVTFKEKVHRIEDYVNQVLYYVRSENAQKDYMITKTNLMSVIRNVAIKNKDDLLENNIQFSIDSLNYEILTDSKWLEFMLNQILSNSIKYKKDQDACIKISGKQIENDIYLTIYDNGIGIIESDLSRVFQKSFTGYNGRIRSKSTGMGLYIVKKLCEKLGHEVVIDSKVNEYTSVTLIFHNNEYYSVV